MYENVRLFAHLHLKFSKTANKYVPKFLADSNSFVGPNIGVVAL